MSATGGSGGPLTNRIDVNFTDAGISSDYHCFAAGLDWSKTVGICIYMDGSGGYGLDNPNLSYLIDADGTQGLAQVAKNHNMLLLVPEAPPPGCPSDNCWYNESTTPNATQKSDWLRALVDLIYSQYNIEKTRVAVGGYSSGAQATTRWFIPRHGAEIMESGVFVPIAYGGTPRVTGNFPQWFKNAVHGHWDTGTADEAYTTAAHGAIGGYNWYTSNGFSTSYEWPAGVPHSPRGGDFQVIMDEQISLHVPASTSTTPPPQPTLIDDYAIYDGQDECIQVEQPGVQDFRAFVLAAHPGTTDLGILRDCAVGGTSEHKEGRAWDWGVDAFNATEKAQADDFLAWLLATDADGNAHAMARRFGIMYMIWNNKMWRAYRDRNIWTDYTGASPHTDHVHFSFSWDGALEQTSYWDSPGSYTYPGTAPEPEPEPQPNPPPVPTGMTYTVSGTSITFDNYELSSSSDIVASGGTVATAGAYTVHTFATSGEFYVTEGGTVDVLVVAGGGGGGGSGTSGGGGGGGAGGVVVDTLTLTPGAYTVTVGAGGAAGTGGVGSSGSNSSFDVVSAVGGGGGRYWNSDVQGSVGGSGGGATGYAGGAGGSGTPGQGNDGGSSAEYITGAPGAGGGGKGGIGGSPTGATNSPGGAGGAGYDATGFGRTTLGGGGGGGQGNGSGNTIGTATAGGGAGGTVGVAGAAGSPNTGGGGGGGGSNNVAGGTGGSGIVVVRYPL